MILVNGGSNISRAKGGFGSFATCQEAINRPAAHCLEPVVRFR